ncbi:helix-turn-helix transcriptional regulator [Deferribacteres bacterium DY0609]
MTQHVETIRVQPGMLLNIIKIPADKEFYMHFDIEKAPFSFECWLQGDVEYFYKNTEMNGSEKIRKGNIIFGATASGQGFCHKSAGTPVEFIQLFIDPHLLQIMLRNTLGNCSIKYHSCLYKNKHTHRFITAKMPQAVMATAKNISQCSKEHPFRNLILANKAQELLFNILMGLFLTSPECTKCSIQPEDIQKFHYIKNIIEENLHQPLSHRQIAKKAGINEFKLKTGFKELFGKTVYGYVLEKRIENAKAMLETGTKSVSDVAWDIGYTNVSHFISVFRKYYGVTPGKFLGSVRQKKTYSQISSV